MWNAGQVETDPIKKSRIANFLKEYWGVKKGTFMEIRCPTKWQTPRVMMILRGL